MGRVPSPAWCTWGPVNRNGGEFLPVAAGSVAMTQDTPQLILITGILAAGKSTVAQRRAEVSPKNVHLRGDLFRRMIVNGQAEMDLELSPEALKQLRLRYQLAATAAGLYLAAGFSVVYQDVIIGRDL